MLRACCLLRRLPRYFFVAYAPYAPLLFSFSAPAAGKPGDINDGLKCELRRCRHACCHSRAIDFPLLRYCRHAYFPTLPFSPPYATLYTRCAAPPTRRYAGAAPCIFSRNIHAADIDTLLLCRRRHVLHADMIARADAAADTITRAMRACRVTDGAEAITLMMPRC